jgi:L-asparaginase/Glu-tRNA(Gln) amidotransferase subunit D
MYSKIPISFVKTIILTFNFKFKLTRQQSKMSQIRLNTKIAIVAQGGTMAMATVASANNQP